MRLAVTHRQAWVHRLAAVVVAAAIPWLAADLHAADATTALDVQLTGLTVRGVELAPVSILPGGRLVLTVNLQGDAPQATYVAARSSGLPMLQRAANGQWVAWDGRPDTRIDNRLIPAGGHLTIPIAAADLSGLTFPIVVFVGYRTAEGLKFCIFNLQTIR